MKSERKIGVRVWIALLCVASLDGTATRDAHADMFRNLGFEEADIWVAGPHYAPAVLPYWASNGFYGEYIYYDTICLGSVCTSIHDRLGYIKPLVGAYSVVLQHGALGDEWEVDDYISQTGDVPPDAKSLMFSSDWLASSSALQVSLDGTAVPFTLYSVGDTVNPSSGPVKTYACDIRAFSGRTDVELRFTARGSMDLDAIEFSPIVVPEPSTLVLLPIGVLSLAGHCCRRCNHAR